MTPSAQQLMDLWTVPPDERPDPHAAFTDDHRTELVDQAAEPGKLAVAFRHTARHTGPWTTALGTIEPTGRTVTGLGIDILTFGEDGRIARIWVLADELQRWVQLAVPVD